MKKLILSGILCLAALAIQAQTYVDLGLPSGTKWAKTNAKGFYTYDEALEQFGDNLPSKEQWEELKEICDWEWTGNGYKVTGPSGIFIVLPAAGYRNCDGGVSLVGSDGSYWSSTPSGSSYAWGLDFTSGSVYVVNSSRCNGQSVRLVQE